MKLKTFIDYMESKHGLKFIITEDTIQATKETAGGGIDYYDIFIIDYIEYTGYSAELFMKDLLNKNVEDLNFKRWYDLMRYDSPTIKELELFIFERIDPAMNNKIQLERISGRPVKPTTYRLVGYNHNFILEARKNSFYGNPRYRLIKEGGGTLEKVEGVYMHQWKRGYYLIQSFDIQESVYNVLDQLDFKIEDVERIDQ